MSRPIDTTATSPDPTAKASAVGRGLAPPIGAALIGSALLGALAMGAVAIGAVAIGSMAIGRMRIGRLEIGRLVITDVERPDETS